MFHSYMAKQAHQFLSKKWKNYTRLHENSPLTTVFWNQNRFATLFRLKSDPLVWFGDDRHDHLHQDRDPNGSQSSIDTAHWEESSLDLQLELQTKNM